MDDATKQEWLAKRRLGITATDAAAVLGVHPYKSRWDVFADKLGLKPDTADNEAMYWGRELEDVIARRYMRDTGYQLRALPPGEVLAHPYHPWLLGTPDRLIDVLGRVWEGKTAGWRAADRWGEAGHGAIPEEYMVQTAVYMAITGFGTCDLAVLIGGQDYRVYNLKRDHELEEMIIEECERFRTDYIVPGREPPPDASDGCRRWLDAKYPREQADLLIASPEADTLMLRLRQLRSDAATNDERQADIEAQLKYLIGEHEGIEGPEGKITWRRAKDTYVTDWQAVCDVLLATSRLNGAERQTIIDANTTIKPGARRFTVPRSWTKGGSK